ncbi:MAG: hypothetical protein ACI4HJ_04945 [Ruminococcus sp.]
MFRTDNSHGTIIVIGYLNRHNEFTLFGTAINQCRNVSVPQVPEQRDESKDRALVFHSFHNLLVGHNFSHLTYRY